MMNNVLKCTGHRPRLIHMLAMLMILVRHLSCLMTALKCFHEIWSMSELKIVNSNYFPFLFHFFFYFYFFYYVGTEDEGLAWHHMSHDKVTVMITQSNVTEGFRTMRLYVVATTHHSRTNDLTTSKALQWAIK